jgi:predicted dehydrogenase
MNRRHFVRHTATVMAGFSVVPGYVLGLKGQTPPSNKLNLACIGVGGQGAGNVQNVSSENIVALCDVDSRRAAKTFEQFPQARRFEDFRKMLEVMDRQIDAVVVSTPDHTHAVAVRRALQMGKHVYCEKPLAHSIEEVRAIQQAARRHKVATQLGNQGHAWDSSRVLVEMIRGGAIGTVREVQAMCASSYSHVDELARLKETPPVPAGLDWDLWLGPAAYRNYHPMYVPGTWRGWSVFGTGVIGDWMCHVLDPVFWALDLGAPVRIQAEAEDYDPKKHGETFPEGTVVRYDFPARSNRPAVKVTWYDGVRRPPRPEALEPGKGLPDTGAVVGGDKGTIVYGSHGATGARLIPDSRMREYTMPAKTLLRSPGHHQEWLQACKSGQITGSNFAYGGALTELALLGLIALRLKGQTLEWHSEKMRFSNNREANALLHPHFREGWKL